jgi:S-adenosyl-L-methionine hydrolase (adenosine-forming)
VAAGAISFLSDYGLQDEFVGVCHGVIARRCPGARVIDLTHSIPPHDVRAGALTLRDCLRFLPTGVHLAIVDPDVGAIGKQARRAIALRAADGQLLVGPDNGLLIPAAMALGGAAEAVDIGASRERLQPLSATFHGRDLFAPVAAALADGVSLSEVGEPLDPGVLRQLQLPTATLSGDTLRVEVLGVDRFGNIGVNATAKQLQEIGLEHGRAVSVERVGGGSPTTAGEGPLAVYRSAFADMPAGEMLLYVDARGMAALAVNLGSAAQSLGAGPNDELVLRPV